MLLAELLQSRPNELRPKDRADMKRRIETLREGRRCRSLKCQKQLCEVTDRPVIGANAANECLGTSDSAESTVTRKEISTADWPVETLTSKGMSQMHKYLDEQRWLIEGKERPSRECGLPIPGAIVSNV